MIELFEAHNALTWDPKLANRYSWEFFEDVAWWLLNRGHLVFGDMPMTQPSHHTWTAKNAERIVREYKAYNPGWASYPYPEERE